MSKKVIAVGIVATLGLGCVIDDGSAVPNSTDLAACAARFQPPDVLAVRLGPSYDAASDYWWDGSIDPTIAEVQRHRSCAGVDGLQAGTVVTFSIERLAVGFNSTCNPWLAAFQPEVLSSAVEASVPGIVGVTIAASSARGPLVGRSATAIRGLFTPSMNPDGSLESRKLPPLAVTRALTWAGDGEIDAADCYDAWVATKEPAP